tara:strand:+ start:5156 stop:5329 length:174 start_codon:yes stop_codon:yes gene_type:complete
MIYHIKTILVMIFWMGIAAGSVIYMDITFDLPDEVSGVLYFISIGIAASSTLNYYRR